MSNGPISKPMTINEAYKKYGPPGKREPPTLKYTKVRLRRQGGQIDVQRRWKDKWVTLASFYHNYQQSVDYQGVHDDAVKYLEEKAEEMKAGE